MNKILLCLLLCMAPAAHALMITQTSMVAVDNTDPGFGRFGGAFQQFNPTLGHLESVNLSFNGTMVYNASFSVPNPSACSTYQYCAGSVNLSDVYQFAAPGFSPPFSSYGGSYFALLWWYQNVYYDPSTALYSYDGFNGHFTSPDLLPQSSGLWPFQYSGSPSSLDGYIGNGNVLIDGTWEGDFGPVYEGILPDWGNHMTLTTTLTYTYTPSVAEPPVLLMFATGLLGMGWVQRRRKRR